MSAKIGELISRVRGVILAVALLTGVGLTTTTVQACPGCRTQGEMVELEEPETVSASLALSWSVVFLLAVLAGIGGFLSIYIRNAVVRVDRENSAG